MRLTCPNCGARYEVDEAMIPAEGRDVQCSNCTTTWFQPGVQQGAGDEADTAPPPEPPSPAHREPTRPIPAADAPEAPEMARAPAPDEAPVARRELDPEVRDVLREEAAREAELRRREGAALEHQDEMPLDEPVAADYEDDVDEVGAAISGLIADADEIGELQDAPRERARDEAAARYGGAGADDPVEAQIAAAAAAAASEAEAASRRDLLPDIEEINSTLRATESRSAGDPGASDIATMVERPRRRTGTRLGFALAILIFAGLIAVYVNATRISEALPQAGPVLQGYVTQVDRLRLWIDEIAQGALTSDDTAAESAPEPASAEPAVAADAAEEDAAPEPEAAAAETDAPVADAAADGGAEDGAVSDTATDN